MRSFIGWGLFAFLISIAPVGANEGSALPGAPSACDRPIDLRAPGQPLEGLVPISQGFDDTNLCGFYAFSAFLDAFRVSRRGESGANLKRSSAVAIGVDNAIRKNFPFWFPLQNSTDPLALRTGRWGSTFCALARAVQEVGYCADAGLPTQTVEETAKFADITTFIYGQLLELAETKIADRPKKLAAILPEIHGKYLGWYATQRTRNGEAPSVMAQDVMRAVIEKDVERPYETIRRIFLSSCSHPMNRKNDLRFSSCEGEFYVGLDATGIPTREQDPLRSERASLRVHELLSRPHAMPVPFAYCSQVLFRGKNYEGATPVGKCGLHWSLIAGRKKIDGECHLLVRNSWNPEDESDYAKDWIVDGGDLWVREKELTRSMLVTQWLED